MAPRLAPGTPFERRAGTDEVRTVTRSTPRRPISRFHHARWWLGHHLDRDAGGEWRDETGWGSERSTVARVRPRQSYRETARSIERDNYAAARHAQVLREEDFSRGNEAERRQFYGSAHQPIADESERRLRGGGTGAREAYERQQADAYAEVRRRRGQAALRRARKART